MLGGVCWIPSAFRVNDRIMIIRVKEVIMITMDGRSIMIVINNKISSVGVSPPFILINEFSSIPIFSCPSAFP